MWKRRVQEFHLHYKVRDAIVWSRPHIKPTLVKLSLFIRPLNNDPKACFSLKGNSVLCQVYPAVRQVFFPKYFQPRT